MPLEPQIARLLDDERTRRFSPRPTETDLAGARASHENDAARFTPPELRDVVGSVEERVIAGPIGVIPLKIYRPLQDAASLPTVVWFHGGGWTTGSLGTGDILARAVCRATPAVVVSVDYRLAPENPWPAGLDDAMSALAWARAHIDELGADPRRLCVGGDSAGGNIAAVVAQLDRDADPQLAMQILLYPVTDADMFASDQYPSLEENATGYVVTRDDLVWCVHNYIPDAGDVKDPRVSPIRASNLIGLPPAVIAVAEYDPLRDQGLAYADALTDAGVTITLHTGDGLIHGYFDMIGTNPAARNAFDGVMQRVRATLGNSSLSE
jgi:acetyl esterase